MAIAFENGWVAFEQGKTLKANPYYKECGEWLLWRNGWRSHRESLFGIPFGAAEWAHGLYAAGKVRPIVAED